VSHSCSDWVRVMWRVSVSVGRVCVCVCARLGAEALNNEFYRQAVGDWRRRLASGMTQTHL